MQDAKNIAKGMQRILQKNFTVALKIIDVIYKKQM